MDAGDFELLSACFETRLRQREMLPLLAAAVGVPERQVFYEWATRRCQQKHSVSGSPWRLFFHGLECDLRNVKDGRYLRYDFGPRGTVDCLTSFGVLQFVMTSKAPWRDYPSLRKRLAERGPPYDYLSGSFTKINDAWARLDRAGCFESADRALVALKSQHTIVMPDGSRCFSLPEGTSDEVGFDMMVANRPMLTARAAELLEAGRERP